MSKRVAVHVKPGSKLASVDETGDGLVLRVTARAIEGAANAACIRMLASYYDVAPSRVTLVRGERSRKKLFEILDA